MSLDTFLTAIFGSLVGTGAVGFVVYISRTWLLERLKQSIAHEYAVKLEEWKRAEQIRIKSEAIASLLAEWMSFPDEQKTLNKLTFEAYLWLPADILQLLTKTLAHEPTAPNAREILARVRQHLLDDSLLKATDIVIFKEENERKAFQAKLQEMGKFTAFQTANAMGAKGYRGRNKPIPRADNSV